MYVLYVGMSSFSPSSPSGSSNFRPRLLFTPAQRKPWRLPEGKIELPLPPQRPAEPGSVNLLISVIPPVILIAGSLIYFLYANDGAIKLWQVIPVVMMSLGFPLANFLNVYIQRRNYRRALQAREAR